jgi:DNA-binding transcriptional LysR family regulator
MIEELKKVLTEKYGKTEKTANLLSFYSLISSLGTEAARDFYPKDLFAEYLENLNELKFINLTKKQGNLEGLDHTHLPNVEAIRHFFVFGETKNSETAGLLLNISPRVLNRGITSLENHFKINLLDRKKSSGSLTGFGKIFLKQSQVILHKLYCLEKNLNKLHKEKSKKSLNIYIHSLWNLDLMANIISGFKKDFPECYINILIGSSQSAEELLVLGEIDIALLGFPPERKEIGFTELIDIPSVIVCHYDEETEWEKYTYVIPSIKEEDLEEKFTGVSEIGDFKLSILVCEKGPCAHIFAKSWIQRHLDNKTFKLLDTLPFKEWGSTINIAWYKHTNLSPLAMQFIYEIKKYFSSSAPGHVKSNVVSKL